MLRFGDALESVKKTLELSQSFGGFIVPETFWHKISAAKKAAAEMKEGVAIDLLVEAKKSLRAQLAGFFRRSPEYFKKCLEGFREKYSPDQDIVGRMNAEIDTVSVIAREQFIDLEKAAQAYSTLAATFAAGEAETKRRLQERYKKRRAEEAAARAAARSAAAMNQAAQIDGLLRLRSGSGDKFAPKPEPAVAAAPVATPTPAPKPKAKAATASASAASPISTVISESLSEIQGASKPQNNPKNNAMALAMANAGITGKGGETIN